VKPVGETEAIRIYPMSDETYGIMWNIHPSKSCWEGFDKENWAKNEKELVDKINKISDFYYLKKARRWN